MAKARVNLKGVNRAVDSLAKDLKNLQPKSSPAARKEIGALSRKLTTIKRLMSGECPEGLFRSFEMAAPTAKGAKSRKRTRKVR